MTQGTVALEDEGIVVRTRWSGLTKLRWRDLGGVRLATLAEQNPVDTLFWKLFGVDVNQPYVRLELKRRVKVGLLWTSGTGVALGLPKLSKSDGLFVKEPAELAEAITRRLAAAGE